MTGSIVRLRVGGVTDVGRARSNNQDSLLLGPHAYVVADGMGGHQGGEVASSLAVDAVGDALADASGRSVENFVAAVQRANETIVDQSASSPTLAGMGTTLVGITVVDSALPDGSGTEELVAIVNVGDSRAYRFSEGRLDQVTHDHSLVAELVRDGQITAAEAETHPQRNIVTRALGIESDIGVDHFEILPRTGDRYLLCSDGLTNEVPEADITDVLARIENPGDAAAELVRQANINGGRDNITVIVADVIDDGGAVARATASVPDSEDFSDAGESTATYAAVIADPDGDGENGADDGDADGDATPSALVDHVRTTSADGAKRPRQRAVTFRSIGFVFVVLAVIGAGLWLVDNYATGTYVVSFDEGEVVIRKGRDLLWYSDEIVSRTDVGAEDVLPDLRDKIASGLTYTSRTDADAYIESLRERIAATVPPVETESPADAADDPADPDDPDVREPDVDPDKTDTTDGSSPTTRG